MAVAEDGADDSVTYTTRIDTSSEDAVLVGVVDGLTAAIGTAIDDDWTLYEAVDPSALYALVRHAKRHDGADLTVEFSVDDHKVTVESNGRLIVE